eukprot:TRINITY_DN47327_c0_g1_i1.p1 TRINITY_DN47327_c0_g1~~TRINITY_DN47327_c0_g1_i1.p1  ORF type:complete len:146 (-),score=20.51 TRINITY_DN47327_c0_g1_i1:128-565(-)
MTTPQRVNATMNLPVVSEADLLEVSTPSQAVSEVESNSSARLVREHLKALKAGEIQSALHAMLGQKEKRLAESISNLSKPSGATSAAGVSIDAASAGTMAELPLPSTHAGVVSPAEVSIDLDLQAHSDAQPCADRHHGRSSKLSL